MAARPWFKYTVSAPSAMEAWSLTRDRHGRSRWSEIQDSVEKTLSALDAKINRAKANPLLYSDKLQEYFSIQERVGELRKETIPALVVVECMVLHGDSRVEDRSRACVIRLDGNRWLVFGLE